MIRITMGIFWLLVILWLLAGRERARASNLESPVAWPPQADGSAEDIEKAKVLAVENARDKIVTFLRSQDPPLQFWKPSLQYIRLHLLQGEGRQGADVQLDGASFKKWIVS